MNTGTFMRTILTRPPTIAYIAAMISCKPLELLSEEADLGPSILDKFRVDDILESRNLGIDISKSKYKAMLKVRMPRMAATYHYDGDLLQGVGGTGPRS